jgi:hypothetical protein
MTQQSVIQFVTPVTSKIRITDYLLPRRSAARSTAWRRSAVFRRQRFFHMTDLVLCFVAAFGAAVYLRPSSRGNG